jgi:hypothetical protein
MPIRAMRPRKNDGLRKYIVQVYERPALRYMKLGEEWEVIADLIFGPTDIHTDKFFLESVRQEGFRKLAALKEAWKELRDDILQAQAQYAPEKKPWGSRFDR